jgi:hypothetical protein
LLHNAANPSMFHLSSPGPGAGTPSTIVEVEHPGVPKLRRPDEIAIPKVQHTPLEAVLPRHRRLQFVAAVGSLPTGTNTFGTGASSGALGAMFANPSDE